MTLLHQAAQKAVEASLSAINEAAKVYASGYASPHHITFTVEGLRNLIAALQQQPEPVAWVPYCHTDCHNGIEGEYRWNEVAEKPFAMSTPENWECRAIYTAPPALQHQEVPREPVDAERTMICKACGFDRFKEPCDRSPCEFVAVASITPQQETRSELSAEDRAILEAVHREMDECDRGNAPGHAHDIPGIWDGDNGAKAGKPCAWCLTWRKFTALVDGAAAPSTPENAGGVKEARDPELWAVHVQGSDDVHAAPSKAEAEAAAQRFNEWAANRPDQHELDPIMHAVAVPWAYSPGAHKCALPHWPEFAGNAGAEGKCECGLSEAACRDPLRRSCPDGVKEADRG